DVGGAIAVEIGNRRRAAAVVFAPAGAVVARELGVDVDGLAHDDEALGRARVVAPDGEGVVPVVDGDDLGLAVAVEVRNGRPGALPVGGGVVKLADRHVLRI